MTEDRRTMIEVRDLVAGYGSTVILDRISFKVYEGEIFVILGGSGCGKSTLLKHLIGQVPVLGGSVVVDGLEITDCPEKEFHDYLRKIGVLFQSGALFGSMTVSENVALPIKEYTDIPAWAVDSLVDMKLKLVGLSGYGGHMPSEISGGMKKRAGLARAMGLNPKILYFDEPSAGLDPITSAELDQLILTINQNLNTTMVIVTHELASIFTVADRIIMLDKHTKKIIADGRPADLAKNSPNRFVRQFFNREPNAEGA